MWGLVLSCFAAVKNNAGAIAVRFFLGVFEAAVTPGFALFTSQWYTKREQGARTGIWFSFNGFAQVRLFFMTQKTFSAENLFHHADTMIRFSEASSHTALQSAVAIPVLSSNPGKSSSSLPAC
jgi:sugar phosphate permease